MTRSGILVNSNNNIENVNQVTINELTLINTKVEEKLNSDKSFQDLIWKRDLSANGCNRTLRAASEIFRVDEKGNRHRDYLIYNDNTLAEMRDLVNSYEETRANLINKLQETKSKFARKSIEDEIKSLDENVADTKHRLKFYELYKEHNDNFNAETLQMKKGINKAVKETILELKDTEECKELLREVFRKGGNLKVSIDSLNYLRPILEYINSKVKSQLNKETFDVQIKEFQSNINIDENDAENEE